MKNTLSQLYLEALMDVLESFGFGKKQAESYLNLPSNWTDDPFHRYPIASLLALLDHVSIQIEEPFIGLKTGYKFRISTFSKTGTIYGFCRDLYDVIEKNATYQKLAIDLGKIDYGYIEGRHFARLFPYDKNYAANRQVIDLVMGSCCNSFGWLSWASGDNLEGLILPYPAPPNKEVYEDLLQCPVSFDPKSSFAALEFTQNAMEQKLPTNDPEKLALTCAKLDEFLDANRAQASLDTALKAAIQGSVKAGGRVTTETVSKRMGQSWSKIRSKLSDPELSFSERTDAVRIEMFYEYYKEGLSFAEISQALAYNDQPAFNRAFKRWFDTSPKKWAEERGGVGEKPRNGVKAWR